MIVFGLDQLGSAKYADLAVREHPEGLTKPPRYVYIKGMKNTRDITGQTFGKLFVITKTDRPANRKDRHSFYLVKCLSCNNEIVRDLRGIKVNKDGCAKCQLKKIQVVKHGHTRLNIKSREYRIWRGMKTRCYNKKVSDYKRYGGRGIIVCDEWKNDFLRFLKDMGKAPTKNHQIDRIKVNGNYSAENCRWATPKEQANNTSRSVRIYIKDKAYTVAEICERYSIDRACLKEYMIRRKSQGILATYTEAFFYTCLRKGIAL